MIDSKWQARRARKASKRARKTWNEGNRSFASVRDDLNVAALIAWLRIYRKETGK